MRSMALRIAAHSSDLIEIRRSDLGQWLAGLSSPKDEADPDGCFRRLMRSLPPRGSRRLELACDDDGIRFLCCADLRRALILIEVVERCSPKSAVIEMQTPSPAEIEIEPPPVETDLAPLWPEPVFSVVSNELDLYLSLSQEQEDAMPQESPILPRLRLSRASEETPRKHRRKSESKKRKKKTPTARTRRLSKFRVARRGGRALRMGVFKVSIEVARPGPRPRFKTVPRLLVDTGSEMTWIPAAILRSLRVEPRKRDQSFVMANGQRITRDVGYAVFRFGDFETVDEVVFAQPGDLQLLGARTLGGFNAVVDSRQMRLVAAGPVPAASVNSPSSWE